MKAHQASVGKNDEWLTPPEILEPLGRFDLDPCAPEERPWDTARHHLSLRHNGLAGPWFGRVWLNPPFNRYQRPKWMEQMALHNNGIMLIPAATETTAFGAYVWKVASAICFLNRRPHFHHVDGTRASANSGCSIVLVAYGESNAQILQNSGLGKTLFLK